MTISSTVRIAGPFIGTSTATVFPFAFKVFTATNLQVVRVDTSTGLESTLLLTTDYTVSLNADQDSNPGGNVTLLAVLATGFNMIITSDIANLQPTDLTNQGGFYPEVITDALDRATIQIQQMADELTRSIKIPVTDGLSLDMELPSAVDRANSFLSFDAAGEPLMVSAGSPGAPTSITRQQFSGTGSQVVYTLASDPGALGNSCEVFVGGVYQQRDTYTISGTTLTFSAAPVAGTDNIEIVNFLTSSIGATDSSLVTFVPAGTGATTRTAQAKMRDVVSVKDFGAVGDGVTNDTAAIQAAATYCSSNSKSLSFVSGATYLTSGTLSIGCDIEGNNSTIKGYLVVAANDIVICDLNLISTNSSIALYLAGSTTIPTYYSRITLDNVRITFNAGVATSTSFGLYASNIIYLKVRNCNIQYGVQLIGCTDYLVSDSILDGDNYSNDNELLHASINSVGQITNNTFINSLDNCIDLYSSGAKTVITGNRFLGCKTKTGAVVEIKISLTDTSNTSSNANGWCEQIIIDGNYFGNTIAYAAQFTVCLSIYYIDSRASPSFTWAETPRNIVVSNNIFDGFDATLHGASYFAAIYLFSATSVVIQGNIFRDMALGASSSDMSSCVWIEECRNILVDGNSMSMKNGTGVSLHKSCFEISVVNNQMLDDLNKSFVLSYGIRITKEGARSDPIVYQSKFIGNTISCSLSAFRNLYTAAGSMTDCVINDNVLLQECSIQTLSKSIVSNNIFSVSSTRNQCLALGNATAITAHNTVVGNKFNTPSGTPKPGITLTRMRGSTVSQNMFQTATYGIFVQGTNVAGELDYLNIKDNFSISQTQLNFPSYSLMNAADTALLQVSNNQKIT